MTFTKTKVLLGALAVAALSVIGLGAQGSLGGIPTAIGAAVDFDTAFKLAGTFTPNASPGFGLSDELTLRAQEASQELALVNISGTMAEYISGAAPTYFAALRIATPTITAGAATNPTTVANLYVEAAPTGGTTNLSAYFAGAVQFAGGMQQSLLAGGSTITLTAADAGRCIALDTAAGTTVTLPLATGTGNRYCFVVTVAATSNQHRINVAAGATNAFAGGIIQGNDSDNTTVMWPAAAASDNDQINLSGTATGGFKGARYEIVDEVTGSWSVIGWSDASGTEATPFATGQVS